MAGPDALGPVWTAHRKWSRVAGRARAALDRWRLWNLSLLILGALLGATAGQTWSPRTVASVLAGLSAMVLAVAAWIQQKKLGKDQTARWTVPRAASETLKAAAYWYLSGVAPYDGDDRDAQLQKALARVDESGKEFLSDYVRALPDATLRPAFNGAAGYVTQRAEQQRDWHAGRVASNEKKAGRLRAARSLATVAAAVLAAVAAANVDVLAWVGLATTLAASFAAHLLATQYEKLATTYAQTSTRLTRLIDQRSIRPVSPESEAEFVRSVEEVLATQNEGWVGLLDG